MGNPSPALPPASSLLSVATPPGFRAALAQAAASAVPAEFPPTEDIVMTCSRTQLDAVSQGGETDSPSEEETS